MSVRRLTRKTNAFSKKLQNHKRHLALYAFWYNFIRPHMSLGKRTTPAMAAGIIDYPLSFYWLLEAIDRRHPSTPLDPAWSIAAPVN